MADDIVYDTPIGEQILPGSMHLSPKIIELNLEEGVIRVCFCGDNGVRLFVEWSDGAGEDATGMIIALNTANLTNNSLKKRINTRAVADGKVPFGIIT